MAETTALIIDYPNKDNFCKEIVYLLPSIILYSLFFIL
jgi:hypothetical protein